VANFYSAAVHRLRGALWPSFALALIDVTVILGKVAILFECKNSGLFSLAKKSGDPFDLASDIRKNLANADKRKGLFQLYDKVVAIKNGEMPESLKTRYLQVERFFPVLLLYDEVPFANVPVTIKNLIDAELKKTGIHDFDYQIWQVDELDLLLNQVPREQIPLAVEDKFGQDDLRKLDLSSSLSKQFGLKELDCPLFVPSGESKAWRILRRLADTES
jgi:hypothetical protein